MSDYMFMLESHLAPEQQAVVAAVQAAAAEANLNVFLTGGAMRDMIAGFLIRDLDFTVEGNSLKLAKSIEARTGAATVAVDDHRKVAEMRFPGDIRVTISMARQEKWGRGARPAVQPATIHDDLRNRDFTINSIALSLNSASKGLLIDPNNGVADIQHREIRTVSAYALYDDPARLLRLIRLKAKLGYGVAERTQSQYANAREAKLERKIPAETLGSELRKVAEEPNAGEILKAFESEGLLSLFLEGLGGPKLNPQGFAKLLKAWQTVPIGIEFPVQPLGLFLSVLTEKLSPKERSALAANTGLTKDELKACQKLEPEARKFEKTLKAAKISRPSKLYEMLQKVPGEVILFLLVRSTERLVQDRLRNYLQKYLPMAHEITDKDVAERGVEPGTPKFKKAKAEMIAARLDARPKKVVVEPEPAPEPPPPPVNPRNGRAPQISRTTV